MSAHCMTDARIRIGSANSCMMDVTSIAQTVAGKRNIVMPSVLIWTIVVVWLIATSREETLVSKMPTSHQA